MNTIEINNETLAILRMLADVRQTTIDQAAVKAIRYGADEIIESLKPHRSSPRRRFE